jgi:methyl-accepting chemotaxis protein
MVGNPLSKAVSALETIADGDYSQNIVVEGNNEISRLILALQKMQQQVKRILQGIASTSLDLGNAAGRLSHSSEKVAQSSADQSEAAGQIASTVEELTVSVDSLATSAQEARELSEESFTISERSSEVIGQASNEMLTISDTVRAASTNISQLGELSGQISGIIEVIKNIADQTNLLALNAAIEAARAGEQGRGFAVVADEVRGLAARTTESTSEITSTIRDIQARTQKAVEVMRHGVEQVDVGSDLAAKAGDSIQVIKVSSGRVKEMFSNISLTLNEQAQASTEVAKNVERIASMTDNNNESVKEVAESAKTLESMAAKLNQAISQFKF